jgi:hypothetical protein
MRAMFLLILSLRSVAIAVAMLSRNLHQASVCGYNRRLLRSGGDH